VVSLLLAGTMAICSLMNSSIYLLCNMYKNVSVAATISKPYVVASQNNTLLSLA